jgi:fatty-acid desaturase
MAESTALLVSTYWATVIAVMLAPVGLCIYAAAWFASRAGVQPKPNAKPGIVAVAVAVVVMVLSASWLHACDHHQCFSLPAWAHFVVQIVLLMTVAISWHALSRAQGAWLPPSNSTPHTDARATAVPDQPPSARAGERGR